MTFRTSLNIRLAVWILAAIIATWTAPRGWHDTASGVLVLLAFIDRSLCRIAHTMEAKAEPEAEPEAARSPMPHWRDKDRPGYTPVRHPLPPIGGTGRSP